MEVKIEMTSLIVQVEKNYKKKLKQISVAQDITMTQMVIDALNEKYKELA